MAETTDTTKSETSSADMVDVLRTIEDRCLAHAVGIPRYVAPEKSWDAVLFSIAGRLFAVRMQEISEILNNPASITRVPGTHPWVVGIANIRGNLLPIINLESFLFQRSNDPDRRSRILVVKHEQLYSGLLVNPFVGIQRFRPSEQATGQVELPKVVEKYIDSVYEREIKPQNENSSETERVKEIWPIFSIRRLIESPEFASAAA